MFEDRSQASDSPSPSAASHPPGSAPGQSDAPESHNPFAVRARPATYPPGAAPGSGDPGSYAPSHPATSAADQRAARTAQAPALSVQGLTKRYDDGTLALRELDLEIPAGRFFGLLGPNGAGKTTLISAICNLIRITEGSIGVFGRPHDSLGARRLVGVAEQDPNLDRFLSVREALVYHGGYYGMTRADARRRAEEMIDVFDLRAKADVRAPKLSGGMRRRLLLARALLHEPKLVILDEPTAGVDIELRRELWDYIRQLHRGGTTILLTTHYLEEAEALCDDIALIGEGRVLARDTARGLMRRYSARTLEDVYLKTVARGLGSRRRP